MWNSYCNQMFGWNWASFSMLIFWLAIILLLIWLVKYFAKGNNSNNNQAANILKERYAKGEISKQEFEDKLKDLKD